MYRRSFIPIWLIPLDIIGILAYKSAKASVSSHGAIVTLLGKLPIIGKGITGIATNINQFLAVPKLLIAYVALGITIFYVGRILLGILYAIIRKINRKRSQIMLNSRHTNDNKDITEKEPEDMKLF